MRQKGFTLVELMIVLAIIAIIAAFAIPNLMKSRMSANEAGAMGVLRTLVTAESTYMNRWGRYATFVELHADELIEEPIKDGEKSGYFFGEITTYAKYSYCVGAVPVEDRRSGNKEYVATQAGTVYEATLTSNKGSKGVTWTPGTDGIPSQFTTTPGSSSDWQPVGG